MPSSNTLINAPIYEPSHGYSTPYTYVGEEPGLGSTDLTELARTFAEVDKIDLSYLFPTRETEERTITIETYTEPLQLLPLVRPGEPSPGRLANRKIFRRFVEPAYFRNNCFIDQHTVNNLRKMGYQNMREDPTEVVAAQIRQMVAQRNRTLTFLQTQAICGGINYYDPLTGNVLNVPTNIPEHNLFSYDGWDANVTKGANVGQYIADRALTNAKGRKEAMFFTSSDNRLGVPWTDQNADIPKCLQVLKARLKKANKNVPTDLYLSTNLYTVLLQNNYIKAASQTTAFHNYQANTTDRRIITASGDGNRNVTIVGGDLTEIAGLRVHTLSQIYESSDTHEILDMMPDHLAVLLSTQDMMNPGESLGFTQHPLGESPTGTPGMWLRVQSPEDFNTAGVPGRGIAMGDAFLPIVKYPHWISILKVCEPNEIEESYDFNADIAYGVA